MESVVSSITSVVLPCVETPIMQQIGLTAHHHHHHIPFHPLGPGHDSGRSTSVEENSTASSSSYSVARFLGLSWGYLGFLALDDWIDGNK